MNKLIRVTNSNKASHGLDVVSTCRLVASENSSYVAREGHR